MSSDEKLFPEAEAGLFGQPTDPRLGQMLDGRYRVVRALGQGAMGTVYAVDREGSDELLAAKILRVAPSSVKEVRQRFEREAKAMALLDHPSIVEVLDFGVLEDNVPFLVMELLSGRPLGEVLDDGPMERDRALVIMMQLLDALTYTHGIGVVHRDLKPDNIFLINEGKPGERAKVVDFGIVKVLGDAAVAVGGSDISRSGVSFGTPDYMSPEQATAQPVDGRSDVYAMGVVLFEMLTGNRPFVSRNPMTLLRMHVSQAPPTLAEASDGATFPDALEDIVSRALMKQPDDRFATALDMWDALDRIVDRRAGSAAPPDESVKRDDAESSSAHTAQAPRSRAWLFGLLLVLLAVVGFAAVTATGFDSCADRVVNSRG